MRYGCLTIIVSLVLVISTFCGSISNALAKDIIINNIVLKSVSDRHYKVADYDRVRIYQRYFDDPVSRQRITKALKDSGIRTLRFHSPVYEHWNINFSEWKNQAHYGADMLSRVIDDVQFLEWCKTNDFQAIFQVNTNNYFDPKSRVIYSINDHPEFITAMAAQIYDSVRSFEKKNLLGSILYIEFGNEDYIGMYNYRGTVPEFYARIVAQAVKKIKLSYPTVKFCVVGQSVDWNLNVPKNKGNWSVAEWERRMFQELKNNGISGNDINYAAHHAYADDEASGMKLAKGSRTSEQDIPDWQSDWRIYKKYKVSETGSVAALRAYLDSIGFYATQIEINEFRRGGYNSYYNRSYMNLLANLDPWTAFINDKNVSGSLIWSSFNNADLFRKHSPWKGPMGYGLFMEREDGYFIPSMPGYLFKIINEFMEDGDQVLQCNDLNCAVLKNNKSIKILYYNKNAIETDLNIKINIGRTFGAINQKVFYADRLDSFIINPSTLQQSEMYIESFQYNKLADKIKIKPLSINVITIQIM